MLVYELSCCWLGIDCVSAIAALISKFFSVCALLNVTLGSPKSGVALKDCKASPRGLYSYVQNNSKSLLRVDSLVRVNGCAIRTVFS